MNLVVNGAHVDSSTLSYSSTTVRYGARPIVDKSVSSYEDFSVFFFVSAEPPEKFSPFGRNRSP